MNELIMLTLALTFDAEMKQNMHDIEKRFSLFSTIALHVMPQALKLSDIRSIINNNVQINKF